MEHKCQTLGHAWESTAVFGWFQCHRVIDTKKVKRGSALVFCDTVAHCPGCIGVRYADVLVVWCPAHFQTCNIEDFQVLVSRSSASYTVPQVEQHPLF